mmetsp:Transcript_60562/g.148924  ORF Transcript_60562/g.148924 Transcript_60562/m.148924 type:complete len:251 (+) Transcript_60562:501-1253(+)
MLIRTTLRGFVGLCFSSIPSLTTNDCTSRSTPTGFHLLRRLPRRSTSRVRMRQSSFTHGSDLCSMRALRRLGAKSVSLLRLITCQPSKRSFSKAASTSPFFSLRESMKRSTVYITADLSRNSSRPCTGLGARIFSTRKLLCVSVPVGSESSGWKSIKANAPGGTCKCSHACRRCLAFWRSLCLMARISRSRRVLCGSLTLHPRKRMRCDMLTRVSACRRRATSIRKKSVMARAWAMSTTSSTRSCRRALR